MSIGQQQQRLIAQISCRDPFGLCERVLRRACEPERLIEQRQALQIVVFQGQRQQRGIDLVVSQALQQVLSQILVDGQLQLRVMALRQRNEGRQEVRDQRRNYPTAKA